MRRIKRNVERNKFTGKQIPRRHGLNFPFGAIRALLTNKVPRRHWVWLTKFF